MQCPQCRTANPPHAKYCVECATALVLRCARCGTGLPETAKFCHECSAPVPGAATRAAVPGASEARRTVDKGLTSRTALEGERKQVTVLFADMKGSLELLADRDPEEASQVLDPLIARLIAAVDHYDGTVNQVMGDGIMALFGAPIGHEDHAVRACYAALRMQEAIERYAGELRGRLGVDVQIRVGLNSGEAIVRSIASTAQSMDYSAVGQTTHLAARMEQLARPGSILMTESTVRLAEGRVRTRALGPVPIKGLAASVPVWELLGAEPARSRVELAAARGLSRFVGREREMEELAAAAARAAAGHGQVVGLLGEPGVGKSRLLWEFRHSGRLGGWLTVETLVLPFGRGAADRPLVELVRTLAEVSAADGPHDVADKVAAQLGLEEAHAFGPPLLHLLEVPVEDERWHALEAGQRHQRTLDALTHLLVRRSRRQPLAVIIEDVHWADADTRAILDALVERLGATRILLVLAYRPEFEHTWSSRSAYVHVRLDALSGAAAAAMLDDWLGGDAGLTPLKRQLAAHTEGNPFFLEESTRHLIQSGALVGSRGAYRLAGEHAAAPVPATVQAVLGARIDRLPAVDKRVLQTAAAIGRDVPIPLLDAACDLPPAVVREALARLQHAEFLLESQLFPEIQYTFRHALTLDVAYGGLVRDRRRQLDARILAALEQGAEQRSDRVVERLAHHAHRGEIWESAVRHCHDAGVRAFTRAAHRAAAEHLERGLEALGHLEATAERVRLGIDIRLDLRNALSPLGEYRKMRATLEAAATASEAIGDRRRFGTVSAFLANFFTLRGEFPTALSHGRRGLEVAEALGDTRLAVLANGFLALAHWGMGDYRLAIERADANAAVLTGAAGRERFGMAFLPAVYSRTIMAWSLAELGEFDGAQSVAEQGLRIAEDAEHAHSLIFACLGLGTVHLRRRAPGEAIAVLERALAVWRRSDLPAVLLELAPQLASAYAQSGRAAEAEALIEQAIGVAVKLRHRLGHWLRTGAMAEAYLSAGRTEEAFTLAQLYVQLTQMVTMRGTEGWAQYLLARAAQAQQPARLEVAESALVTALRLAGELGMRPLEACVRSELAAVLRAAGRAGDADAHAAIARDLEEKLGL